MNEDFNEYADVECKEIPVGKYIFLILVAASIMKFGTLDLRKPALDRIKSGIVSYSDFTRALTK